MLPFTCKEEVEVRNFEEEDVSWFEVEVEGVDFPDESESGGFGA